MENEPPFSYTYSAQRQREIEAIRESYLPREEDKMDMLRKLHRLPEQKAQAVSIGLGVAGALVLGTGMSLCMTELGLFLGEMAIVAGILTGLAGIALVSLAYPVYNKTLKKERERIAPQILRLTEELLNETQTGGIGKEIFLQGLQDNP